MLNKLKQIMVKMETKNDGWIEIELLISKKTLLQLVFEWFEIA